MLGGQSWVPLTGPAVVDVTLTVTTCVASLAEAAVGAVGVLAGGTVAARALHTLIDVDLAGLTCEDEIPLVALPLPSEPLP